MGKIAVFTFFSVLTLASNLFAVSVSVAVPSTNSTVASPVTIKATASSSKPITGWRIYVDGNSAYAGGAQQSIAPAVSMTAGTHQLLVRAWDSTGSYGSTNLNVTVGPSNGIQVTVNSPLNPTVSSPATIAATASSPVAIVAWRIYVDSTSVYTGGPTSSISAPLTMTAGTHSVVVRAWDTSGAYDSANLSLIVVNQTAITPSHHIFVISEENTSYHSVIGNTTQMPYLNSLVPQATVWGNYYANAHGSMLAYIETLSGQTFNCTVNDCGASGAITGSSLMSVMNSKGMVWKGYIDGLSTCGQLAPQSTNWIINPDSNGHNYFQRHTGFPWYAVGTATTANCTKSGDGWYPMSQLTTDLANNSVGKFNWISPDGYDDGHDTGVVQQDAFMQKWLTPLLASSYFQPGGDGILIIWWDEADLSNGACGGPDGKSCGGQIPMMVMGPGIRTNNFDNTPANHDSTLRFIQEQLGLTPSLGKSVSVPDFSNTLSQ